MNRIKRFFQPKFRIIYEDAMFKVQEHKWWDLIYGWWYVDAFATLEEAKKRIEILREKEKPPVIVFTDY